MGVLFLDFLGAEVEGITIVWCLSTKDIPSPGIRSSAWVLLTAHLPTGLPHFLLSSISSLLSLLSLLIISSALTHLLLNITTLTYFTIITHYYPPCSCYSFPLSYLDSLICSVAVDIPEGHFTQFNILKYNV